MITLIDCGRRFLLLTSVTYVLKRYLCTLLYVEDITWPRGDTKFLFSCWKIFHEWAQRTTEIFFQHEKRNFVSSSGLVMFYLLYKHQWNTKQFLFNSFIGVKGVIYYVAVATVIDNNVLFTCEDIKFSRESSPGISLVFI